MKAMPTLEGGLRIDTEDAEDWEMLRAIVTDATPPGSDLAARLGELISADAGAEDWEEFVVPDLREGFQDELAQVGAAIESAIFNAEGAPGPLWIAADEGLRWYGALNQARLALEEEHHFGPLEWLDPKGLKPARRKAFARSRFYCAVQSLLLDYVMK